MYSAGVCNPFESLGKNHYLYYASESSRFARNLLGSFEEALFMKVIGAGL